MFWRTGNPVGHIAISLGNGSLATSDAPGASKRISIVPITTIDRWGLRVGWAPPYWPAHSSKRPTKLSFAISGMEPPR